MKNTNYTLIIFTIFFISGLRLFSQEAENKKFAKFIGIETGYVLYGSEFSQPDLIRKQDQYSYPSDIYNNTIMNNWYIGAKTEFRSKDYNIGVLTGLRFSSLYSASGNKNSEENNDFYYFLFREEDTSIEYLRLQGISHRAGYVGIPLEIRYFIINTESVGLFCKASVELHYLLNSTSNVHFLLDDMEKYEDEVISNFEKSNDMFSAFYLSGGLKLGKIDEINFNLEAVLPSFIITGNNSIINNPFPGGGFQFNIQIPL